MRQRTNRFGNLCNRKGDPRIIATIIEMEMQNGVGVDEKATKPGINSLRLSGL